MPHFGKNPQDASTENCRDTNRCLVHEPQRTCPAAACKQLQTAKLKVPSKGFFLMPIDKAGTLSFAGSLTFLLAAVITQTHLTMATTTTDADFLLACIVHGNCDVFFGLL